MNQPRHSISGQRHPDDAQIDWSQVGETLAMLSLAVAQIEMSMKEGSQSVDKLSENFTDMASHTLRILDITRQGEDEASHRSEEIHQIASQVSNEIQQAIVAFQFYDRLSQRLDHVSHSLEQMGHLMSDNRSRYHQPAWQDLQNRIKGNYTMEAERIMFEHIMAGHSVSEALEIYHHHFEKKADESYGTSDDIELF